MIESARRLSSIEDNSVVFRTRHNDIGIAPDRLPHVFDLLAGRDSSPPRPGLVAGKRFALEHPLWGTLIGIKRGGSHLFLRYAFVSAG